MDIKIKKLRESATIPTRGSKDAAGYDLYASGDQNTYPLYPGKVKKIPTGVAMAIPRGYFGAIFARSGLATKRGLRPANCVGVIDSDYRGEIIVALRNDSKEIQTFENGERIAQIVIMPYLDVDFVEADELDETERADGGFGSTG